MMRLESMFINLVCEGQSLAHFHTVLPRPVTRKNGGSAVHSVPTALLCGLGGFDDPESVCVVQRIR